MPRVMVLCAGLGTRLRPLTHELPKPLVPVGDRSLLGRIQQHLQRFGVSEVVINTHHLSQEFEKISDLYGAVVRVVHEPEIRGTAGGVAGARAHLEAPCLIWNGDIWCEPPVDRLLAAEAPFTLLVAPRAKGQGSVGLGVRRDVVRLRGECFGDEVQGADYVGIAALSAQILERLPERGCLIGDVALPWLRQGHAIETLELSGSWSDLGNLERYLAANLEWLGERDSWLGEGARVAPGVTLVRSLVGAGARVEGAGTLEGCVVWPGALAEAPARQTVFGRGFRVASS
ncbi:MAG: sugar phosphate nucleotidyltransferase [Polyangiaceae bacterium]